MATFVLVFVLVLGYVRSIEAFTLADVLRRLGACRERPGEDINLAVGLEIKVQLGQYTTKGMTMMMMMMMMTKTT